MDDYIEVIPLGGVGENILNLVADKINQKFGYSTRIAPRRSVIKSTYNPSRRQYKADAVLESLQRYRPRGAVKLLAVTEADLYSDEVNFVFGQAQLSGQHGIISLNRLRTRDTEIFEKRIAKEAVHELGHTFGLEHCDDSKCVMSFSSRLAEADEKTEDFCTRCSQKLNLPK